jgi:hypothetical protein
MLCILCLYFHAYIKSCEHLHFLLSTLELQTSEYCIHCGCIDCRISCKGNSRIMQWQLVMKKEFSSSLSSTAIPSLPTVAQPFILLCLKFTALHWNASQVFKHWWWPGRRQWELLTRKLYKRGFFASYQLYYKKKLPSISDYIPATVLVYIMGLWCFATQRSIGHFLMQSL